MAEPKASGGAVVVAVYGILAVLVGGLVMVGMSYNTDYKSEVRMATIDLDNAMKRNALYAGSMAAAIETRFLNIEQELDLLRGSSAPLGERIVGRDLSLSERALLAEIPAYQMYTGAYDERAPYNAEVEAANRRLDDLEGEVRRLKGLLPPVILDPEFLESHAARVQEAVDLRMEKHRALRDEAKALMDGAKAELKRLREREGWKQEITRFRFDQSMIGKQIDDLERSFEDYQAKVAGEKLAAMDIEWLEESRCEDGVCTSTFPAAERRWEILSDEAREASTAELSQRHASELKALSGRVDDLGDLLRQSISDHHEMRGLLAYYGIDPETGEIRTDLEADRQNPWVRRAQSLEAENARLKEALGAAGVEMSPTDRP